MPVSCAKSEQNLQSASILTRSAPRRLPISSWHRAHKGSAARSTSLPHSLNDTIASRWSSPRPNATSPSFSTTRTLRPMVERSSSRETPQVSQADRLAPLDGAKQRKLGDVDPKRRQSSIVPRSHLAGRLSQLNAMTGMGQERAYTRKSGCQIVLQSLPRPRRGSGLVLFHRSSGLRESGRGLSEPVGSDRSARPAPEAVERQAAQMGRPWPCWRLCCGGAIGSERSDVTNASRLPEPARGRSAP